MQPRSVSQEEEKRKNPALPGSAKWCSFSSGTLSFLFLSVSLRMLSLAPCLIQRKTQTIWLAHIYKAMAVGVVDKYCVSFRRICGFSSLMVLGLWEMCCDWMSGKYIIVCYWGCRTLLSQHLYASERNCQSLTLCHLTFFLLGKAVLILVAMLGSFQEW